jgi:riboflavin biosynthesis pyrimidine reductase
VIIVVSKHPPADYIAYFQERKYNIIVGGAARIDFRAALDRLGMYYNVKTVLTDSGGGLTSTLLAEGLVDELVLLISPTIVGRGQTNLFRYLEGKVNLELVRSERIRNHLLVVYRVLTNINILTPLRVNHESRQFSDESEN